MSEINKNCIQTEKNWLFKGTDCGDSSRRPAFEFMLYAFESYAEQTATELHTANLSRSE